MFKKIMQYLFGSSEKISLSYLKEAGEKTLQGDGKIYGQNGNVIATFEKFTQPVEKVTNGIFLRLLYETIASSSFLISMEAIAYISSSLIS